MMTNESISHGQVKVNWVLRINFISWNFTWKFLNEHFLCCHEQMKKHLEAPYRSLTRPACKSGEFILIGVWKYLQKEKEETNFLYKEYRSKRGKKSTTIDVWHEDKGSKYLLMNMWYSIEKRKLPFEGNPPPINTPPHSQVTTHNFEIESLSLFFVAVPSLSKIPFSFLVLAPRSTFDLVFYFISSTLRLVLESLCLKVLTH